MRTRLIPTLAAVTAAAAAAVLAAAASMGGANAAPSVAEFVSLATAGVHTDYTPLASPKDAVDKADLIVEGTLTDVVDGIVLQYPDSRYTARKADSYVTLVINVNKVIDGDPNDVSGGRVYLALAKSPVTSRAELAAANPKSSVVAVLDDVTTWVPATGVTVQRPTAIPAEAKLFAPYTDGLWLQGSTDTEAHGLGAHRDELTAAWNSPQQVTEIAAALQRAAGK